MLIYPCNEGKFKLYSNFLSEKEYLEGKVEAVDEDLMRVVYSQNEKVIIMGFKSQIYQITT